VARTFEIDVRSRPPSLALASPSEGAMVIGPRLHVYGKSEPGTTIEVARTRTVADARGAFVLEVPIARGLSNLVILASDAIGNQRRITRSVVWE
jgi:hypothetical protein